ncbi:Hypothetical protein A7982_04785 [Minicystis rosea]|nr:Hypothetical protein A7982_04785 [Minicystis rosea]
MRFVWNFGVAALAAGIALAGCQKDTDLYPAPPGCEGSTCTPSISGGSTPEKDGGQGGGGTGGAPATIDQTGTVHRIVSSTFDDTSTQPYTGAATIVALPQVGGMVSTMYGGAAGTTFSFTKIPSGPAWFLVQDDTGGTGEVLSTISFASLPVLSNFTLPIIDLGTMQNIAYSLPTVSSQGVSTLAAQVILFVYHANAPYKGVQVVGGAGGAKIAYDNGSGYSDSATATGTNGTVILFNAGLSSLSKIVLKDTSTQQTYEVPVQVATGAATLAGIDIP